jgi:alpha-tubulin suppressor-like RCC1 family protein
VLGRDDFGQLGLGDKQHRGDNANEMGDNLPYVDLGAAVPKQIHAGSYHTCAILNSGRITCWGLNAKGQLGLNDTNNRGDNPGETGSIVILPQHLVEPVRTAFLGTQHTCVVTRTSTNVDLVRCWGANDVGQLGYGDTVPRGDNAGEMQLLSPVNFGVTSGPVLPTILQAVSKRDHNCVLFQDPAAAAGTGVVKCWGSNGFGALGTGDAITRGDGPLEMGANLPFLRSSSSVFHLTQVRVGADTTCGSGVSSRVSCWGFGSYGMTGQGNGAHLGDGPGEILPPAIDLF